jgi:hypothetical protein
MLYLALSSRFTLRDYLAFTALLGVLLAVGGYGCTASASSALWLQAGGQARLLTVPKTAPTATLRFSAPAARLPHPGVSCALRSIWPRTRSTARASALSGALSEREAGRQSLGGQEGSFRTFCPGPVDDGQGPMPAHRPGWPGGRWGGEPRCVRRSFALVARRRVWDRRFARAR